MHTYLSKCLFMFLPMSKFKLLLTGLAFAYKQLLVFMHTAHCVFGSILILILGGFLLENSCR